MSSSTSSSESWRTPAPIGFRLAAAALTAVIAVGLSELTVRALGRQPFSYSNAVRTSPRMVDPDPVIGWTNRPGVYAYSPAADGSHPIEVTVDPGGARRVAGASPAIYFLGGSLTFGFGVSDGETFPDVIAARTERATVNLGSPGYGPVQALRAFRRAMADPREDARPAAVVYGLIAHHKKRAALDPTWIRNWDLLPPGFRDVRLPYARLGDRGEVIEFEPTRHTPWPLRHQSALIAMLEERIIDLYWGISEPEMDRTLVAVLAEIQRECEARGARFLVAGLMMDDAESDRYAEGLSERGVRFVDCRHEHYRRTARSDEFIVPNDGHPNAVVHRHFADCILREMSESLAPLR